MKCSNDQQTDIRECLRVLLENKNKNISFEEWKNKKKLNGFEAARIREEESFIIRSFDRLVQNANKKSLSDWLKIKNAEAKKIDEKQKKVEVCLKKGVNEFEELKKDHSKKAFRTWLQMKKKETKEKDLRMKKDQACCNICDEYFLSLKSEYNKKAMNDWLCYLKTRHE